MTFPKYPGIALLAVALLLLLGAGVWLGQRPKVAHHVEAKRQSAETIEASGKILGIAIGSPIQAARDKLDPLRVPGPDYADAKASSGRRIYWKLKETEYDWVMVWGKEGKISRMRAVFRTEQTKPFAEIGNLQNAASANDNQVKWDLRRPNGSPFRLIAQGVGQRATTVYMFSLETGPAEEQRRDETSESREKP
jgi:hypothetical protein